MKVELWRMLSKDALVELMRLRNRLEWREQESEVDKLVKEIRRGGDLRVGKGSGEGDMAKRSATRR